MVTRNLAAALLTSVLSALTSAPALCQWDTVSSPPPGGWDRRREYDLQQLQLREEQHDDLFDEEAFARDLRRRRFFHDQNVQRKWEKQKGKAAQTGGQGEEETSEGGWSQQPGGPDRPHPYDPNARTMYSTCIQTPIDDMNALFIWENCFAMKARKDRQIGSLVQPGTEWKREKEIEERDVVVAESHSVGEEFETFDYETMCGGKNPSKDGGKSKLEKWDDRRNLGVGPDGRRLAHGEHGHGGCKGLAKCIAGTLGAGCLARAEKCDTTGDVLPRNAIVDRDDIAVRIRPAAMNPMTVAEQMTHWDVESIELPGEHEGLGDGEEGPLARSAADRKDAIKIKFKSDVKRPATVCEVCIDVVYEGGLRHGQVGREWGQK